MNTVKKTLILTSLLIVPFLSSCSQEENVVVNTINGVTYYLYGDKANLTVSFKPNPGYNMEEVTIPRKIQQGSYVYTVVAISNNAFLDNKALKKITIPDTVEIIGINAFKNCTNLNKVVLSDNLTVLSQNVFYNCTSLENIEGGENINTVYSGALAYTPIKSFSLAEGGSTIHNSAFEGCKNLESFNISSSIEKICSNAFKNCNKLNNIDLSLIKEVGKSSFESCKSIANFNLDSIETIGSKAFYNTSISSLTFNDSIKNIDSQAFENCTKLTHIDFKNASSLIKIGRRAFYNCDIQNDLDLKLNNLKYIQTYAFRKNNIKNVSLYNDVNFEDNIFDENVNVSLNNK